MRRLCLCVMSWLGLALGGSVTVAAPSEVPPPPPPPEQKPPGRPPQEGQPYRPGPSRGGLMPGGAPGMYPRGDRERMDTFRQLSEEEKARVRSAFEKAWNKPEVMEARERLMKVNEEYRAALHRALEAADPGITRILEKARPPLPPGGPFLGGRMPEPSDPEFFQKAVARFETDLQNLFQGERREGNGSRFRERVMNAPAVRDLMKQLQAAEEPQRRTELYGRLREAFAAAVRAEFGQFREGSPRREGPPPNGGLERREERREPRPEEGRKP